MTTSSVRWIYILEEDFIHDIRHLLPHDWNRGYVFFDTSGKRRLEIHADGKAVVLAGYAWDGCTPKWAIFDILVGTPDGAPSHHTKKPKTYYASLLHDAFCQFLNINPDVPRAKADKVFLELLIRDGFAPRYVYYVAVLIFGKISHALKRWHRKYGGHRQPIESPQANERRP